MTKEYVVTWENTCGIPIGTIVYSAKYGDYGCANMDSRDTGEEHISVSMTPDGDYPYVTCQIDSLAEVLP